MNKIFLTDNLRTGLKWQDKEHEELFKRVNALVDSIEQGSAREAVVDIVGFLDEYVVVHFHNEELAMHSSRYPSALEHMQEHTEFIGYLAGLKKEIEGDGVSDALASQMQEKIIDWLKEHVGKIDKELGSFLVKGALTY